MRKRIIICPSTHNYDDLLGFIIMEIYGLLLGLGGLLILGSLLIPWIYNHLMMVDRMHEKRSSPIVGFNRFYCHSGCDSPSSITVRSSTICEKCPLTVLGTMQSTVQLCVCGNYGKLIIARSRRRKGDLLQKNQHLHRLDILQSRHLCNLVFVPCPHLKKSSSCTL